MSVASVVRSARVAALSERGWRRGRDGEADAVIGWRECGAGSLRFPPFAVPDI